MTTEGVYRSIEHALAEIRATHAEEEASNQSKLRDAQQELDDLQVAIRKLHEQLAATARYRAELLDKSNRIPKDTTKRAYHEIFRILRTQAEALKSRSESIDRAREAREATFEEQMRSGEVETLVKEYREYRSHAEEALSQLPASYRAAISRHHAEVAERLEGHLSGLSEPIAVDEERLSLEIVYGIDGTEASPELMIVVLPMSPDVHSGWVSRPEDLQSWLAIRVVQAVYETCGEAGPLGVQVACGGHQGLLVIEVEIAGCKSNFADTFRERVEQVIDGAPELVGAAVGVRLCSVPVDSLMPPDEGDHA